MVGPRQSVQSLIERYLPPGLTVWDIDYSQVPLEYLLAVHLSCTKDPLRRATVGYMPYGLDVAGEEGWCRDFADFATRALGNY